MHRASVHLLMILPLLAPANAGGQETSPAAAQQQSFPAQPQNPGTTTAPDGTVPPPPHAQPQTPHADQAKPPAVGPAQAKTAGRITGETPPGSTRQTLPSTISQENAALDKLPITALQFPLNERQKKLIVDGVIHSPRGPSNQTLHVADFLPTAIAVQTFPTKVTQEFPAAARYRYVTIDDQILIVDPTNMTIVGEIKR